MSRAGCRVAALLAIVIFGSAEPVLGQAESLEAKRLRNEQLIRSNLESLEGRVLQHDESLDLIVKKIAQHDEIMQKIDTLTKWVSASEKDNQKNAFIEGLLKLACRNIEDNCELRKEVTELERRLSQLERKQGGGKRNIPPAPLEPIANPATPTERPSLQVWHGHLDFITDQRASFCPNAALVVRGVFLDCADGDANCYGDMYQDCRGRFVFLRQSAIPHSVAYH